MFRIFKAELFKCRHNMSFFLSLLASVPLGILYTVICELDKTLSMAEILSGVVSYYSIFFIIMITMYVTNDYEKGTIKAIMSSGVSKSGIYFGRLLVSIVVSEVMFLLAFAGAGAYGFLRGIPMASAAMPWTTFQFVESVGVQMLIVAVYAMLGYFISVLIKKQMPAMIVAIIVINCEPLLIGKLSEVLHADLSVLDFTSMIEQIEMLNLSGNVLIGTGIFALVVFVATFIIGTAIFKHRDI